MSELKDDDCISEELCKECKEFDYLIKRLAELGANICSFFSPVCNVFNSQIMVILNENSDPFIFANEKFIELQINHFKALVDYLESYRKEGTNNVRINTASTTH